MKKLIAKLLVLFLFVTLIPVGDFDVVVKNVFANEVNNEINEEVEVLEIEPEDELIEILDVPFEGRLVAENDTITSDNVVGFQLQFNKQLINPPDTTDFSIEGGVVYDVYDFLNNNYWVLVIPSGDDVEISLTLNAETVESIDLEPNEVIGPATMRYMNSPFSGEGEGTIGDPYLIASCSQLQEMEKDLDAYYRLQEDINCIETQEWNLNPLEFDDQEELIPDELDNVSNNGYRGFNPIGSDLSPFRGTLDGNGKQISNLWIFRQYNDNVGLFSYISGATIYNLALIDSEVVGAKNTGTVVGYAADLSMSEVNVVEAMTRAYRESFGGGLVGTLVDDFETSEIMNSFYEGDVHGTGNVIGGLVGRMLSGTIFFSRAEVNIDGGYNLGGVVGEMQGGGIFGTEVSGIVTLEYDDRLNKPGTTAGGFVGYMTGNSQIVASSADVTVTTVGNNISLFPGMGGFAGVVSDNALIVYSYASGDVIGVNGNIGGFVGFVENNDDIATSYATGSVSGGQNVGGFAGRMFNSTVSDIYATGTVTGQDSVGGVVGDLESSSLSNAYSSGSIEGANEVGGLVGTMLLSELNFSFSVSSVLAQGEDFGGLVGSVDFETSDFTHNYFDPLLTGVQTCSNQGDLVDDCIGLQGYNFFDEDNLPFTLNEERVWNVVDNDLPVWNFEDDAYPVLHSILPVVDTLEATLNGTESVTLRGELVSGEREQLILFFLVHDTDEIYFNNQFDFLGAPLGPIFGYDLDSNFFELTVPISYNEDSEEGLLCGTTYYYMSLGILGFESFLFNRDNNFESFETPSCDNAPSVPRSNSGSSGSRSVVAKNEVSGVSEYAREVAEVKERKIVEKELDVFANKCEALVMMSRVFEWKISEVGTSRYVDVPEWCQSVAAFGTERGIVEGRSVDRLGMETPLTRNEVAMMVLRELKKKEYKFEGVESVEFTDAIIEWARDGVGVLVKEGIIKGFSDGTFGGDKYMLKQDLGVMLLRILKKS